MTPDKIVDFIQNEITGTPAPVVVAPPPAVVAPPPAVIAPFIPAITTSALTGLQRIKEFATRDLLQGQDASG